MSVLVPSLGVLALSAAHAASSFPAAVGLLADGGATPTLRPGLDPDQVGPGTIGFVMTFLLAAAVVLLVLDHTRRQRRMKNRFDYAMRRETEEARRREAEAAPQRESAAPDVSSPEAADDADGSHRAP